jgi:hypothetical protein
MYNNIKLNFKEKKMADIVSLEDECFTEESYQEYLKGERERHNDMYREDGETIFDALSSNDADFIKTPDGERITNAVRSYK